MLFSNQIHINVLITFQKILLNEGNDQFIYMEHSWNDKISEWEMDYWQGLRREKEEKRSRMNLVRKERSEGFCVDANVLYFVHCRSNVIVETLCHSFARYYLWGQTHKWSGYHCAFSYNWMLVQHPFPRECLKLHCRRMIIVWKWNVWITNHNVSLSRAHWCIKRNCVLKLLKIILWIKNSWICEMLFIKHKEMMCCYSERRIKSWAQSLTPLTFGLRD